MPNGGRSDPPNTVNTSNTMSASERMAAATVTVEPPGGSLAGNPDAETFERLRDEKRADGARKVGGRTPKVLNFSKVQAQTATEAPHENGATPKRRRISEAEREQSFELLRRVPGLSEDDARDLARCGSPSAVTNAIAQLKAALRPPRNVGGWLRRAIEQGWTTRSA